jgi:hypothetical protein
MAMTTTSGPARLTRWGSVTTTASQQAMLTLLDLAPMRGAQYRLFLLSTGGTLLNGFSLVVLGVALPLIITQFAIGLRRFVIPADHMVPQSRDLADHRRDDGGSQYEVSRADNRPNRNPRRVPSDKSGEVARDAAGKTSRRTRPGAVEGNRPFTWA